MIRYSKTSHFDLIGRIFLLWLFLGCPFYSAAQSKETSPDDYFDIHQSRKPETPIPHKRSVADPKAFFNPFEDNQAPVEENDQMIFLEHSNTLYFDKDLHPDYQILVGDVRFRHDSVWMYCDTAHYYQASNSLFAYGHVSIEQGDTLFIYGKTLHYDGNRRIARIRENVRMINRGVTLYTDSLDYDRDANIGYYSDGGQIVDTTNVLSSIYGQYSPSTKMAFFKDSVSLVNPQFTMDTDTLNYNTETGVASIVSPTLITAENAVIHAFRGWYDTKADNSLLLDRSYIWSDDKYMIGDSIYYSQGSNIGKGYSDILMKDTTRHISILGDYAYSDMDNDYSLVSRNAVLKEYSGSDTLHLHADTLLMRKDSTFNIFQAYHHVRFFRPRLQGVCDSMHYSEQDSVLDINGQPILWADNQMVRGVHMKLYLKDENPDYLHVEKNAVIISQEARDTSLFNQSQGSEIKAFFKNGDIEKIFITGNSESIYLPHDEYGNILGLNRLEKGDVEMYLNGEGQLDYIKVAPSPKGKFYPMALTTSDVKKLSLFSWPEDIRPTGPDDIFRNIEDTDNKFVDTSVSGGDQQKKPARTRKPKSPDGNDAATSPDNQ